jgi:hypothetical protein
LISAPAKKIRLNLIWIKARIGILSISRHFAANSTLQIRKHANWKQSFCSLADKLGATSDKS